MQVKKPETIADLQINWDFNQNTYHYFADFYLDFQNKNPDLTNYKIIPKSYNFNYESIFLYDNSKFSFLIKVNSNDTLVKLMYFIHNEIALFLKRDNIQNLTLSRFVKTDNNSFEIEEDLPF